MRRKITIMVPQGLMGLVDDTAKRYLGVGRNAFFCLGGMLLIARLSLSMSQKKRATLISDLQTEWDALMVEVRKAL
jgi:hypothetical protein